MSFSHTCEQKAIGGTQDSVDEALLVEPGENASLRLNCDDITIPSCHSPALHRKTIGGTQDSIDEALLVEPGEDASLDLPPLLIPESEVDHRLAAFLDWRVGVSVGRDRLRVALERCVGE